MASDYPDNAVDDFVVDFAQPAPGFVAIHGNAMEQLADVLIDWQRTQPLPPLAQEVVLVQSNGVAEWFKMRMAARCGVCAASAVQLAARFAWRSWRQILGAQAVPSLSPLDEGPMTWRLMRLIPQWVSDPATAATFAPLARFLWADGDQKNAAEHPTEHADDAAQGPDASAGLLRPTSPKVDLGRGQPLAFDGAADPAAGPLPAIDAQRLAQLAARLADVLDQYQVYRADWLSAWAAGADDLPAFGSQPARALPEDLAWQPALWRALWADLTPAEHAATRDAVRARVIARLNAAEPGSIAGLPARVSILGLNHMPQSMLEFLAALSRHTQILLAVPNPCRYHWADAIDGRELLRQTRRRQPLRGGRDLSHVDLADMHAHAHPLLMAWARQSRDFVRLLDDWDADSATTARAWQLPRIDVFDDAPTWSGTLLQQLQRSIRDMAALGEHPCATGGLPIRADDQSIVFHRAHSLVRELEVLHDALLSALAAPPATDAPGPLTPKDIIVMLPDIRAAAPAIRAVFGQYPAHDPRHIPFDIADLSAQDTSAVFTALGQLLHMHTQRWTLPVLSDWLEIPAVAARLGLHPEDSAQLQSWMADAGLRWGLNAEHRARLGLGAAGGQNSAEFALERMLRGWVMGHDPEPSSASVCNDQIDDDPFSPDSDDADDAAPTPFANVAGLAAYSVGALWALIRTLNNWATLAQTSAAPTVWAERLRELTAALFAPSDQAEQAALATWHAAIDDWLRQCEAARFDAPIALPAAAAVLQEALCAPGPQQRFHAGGVTFCTPMPMRAIPFEMVCLLGLDEGQWPRRASPNGLDLLQRPGHYRPGDRQRRDHDRQLMLEAVLSARRTLYLSHSAHSVRDNTSAPPSVLLAQLRDYLAAGWAAENQYTADNPDNPNNPLNTRIAAHSDASPLLIQRTFNHPMQPFSRRYFEAGCPHPTWAREWASVHTPENTAPNPPNTTPSLLRPTSSKVDLGRGSGTQPTLTPITLQNLIQFFQNPAASYFKNRLHIYFDDDENPPPEDEPLSLDRLTNYKIQHAIQNRICQIIENNLNNQSNPNNPISLDINTALHRAIAHHQHAGVLPIAAAGRFTARALHKCLAPGLQHWAALRSAHPHLLPSVAAHVPHPAWPLRDWLHNLRLPQPAHSADEQTAIALEIHPRAILQSDKKPQAHRLTFAAFLRQMLAQIAHIRLQTHLIGIDGWIILGDNISTPQDNPAICAHSYFKNLQDIFAQGQDFPLPLPQNTALAYAQSAQDKNPQKISHQSYSGGYQKMGENQNLYWQRIYPDFASLIAEPAENTMQNPDNADNLTQSLFAQYANIVYVPFLEYLKNHTQSDLYAA